MKQPTIDEKVEHYYSLKPGQYPSLERMEVHQPIAQEGELPQVSLQVIMRPVDSSDTRRLILCFSGIRDFSFKPFAHPFQFTVLEVASMEDRQWEQDIYRVANAEQDTEFKFFCLDFTAELKSLDVAES